MTAQIPAEGPFYRADGSFLGYVGVAATLKVDLVATQESGPPEPQDLTGRVFLQRILDGEGQTLREIYGINGVDGIAHRIAFPLTEADDLALLPTGGAVARDLTYAMGEVTIGGFDQIYSAPFALRRVRRGMPSTVLQLEPNVGIVLVRYAGAPPLSLLEELIASGDLAEDATHEDLVTWLQNPANDAGQTVLQQIAAAGLAVTAEDGTIDQKAATIIADEGLLDTEARSRVAAEAQSQVAGKVAESAAADGDLFVAVAAGVQAVATREGQAVSAGGAIDRREDEALTAVDTAGAARIAEILATPGFDTLYPNAYATALPRGVTSGTIGGTSITGATPGTYALTAVGGSITGVQANLVVASPTSASIVIVNPGLGSGTTPPTWANPAGATIPVGTTLTAVVGSRIAVTGRYLALSSDGLSLQGYQNDGTSTPAALAGVSIPTKTHVDTLFARLFSAVDADNVMYLVDGSDDQNILAKWDAATGQMTFAPDDYLQASLDEADKVPDLLVPSGRRVRSQMADVTDSGLATVTAGTTKTAALTKGWYYAQNPELFTWIGGIPQVNGSYYGAKATTVSSGGNMTGGLGNQGVVRFAFQTDADDLNICVRNTSTLFRIMVDGQYLSESGSVYANSSGGIGYIRMEFADSRSRRVDFEYQQNGGIENVGTTPAVWTKPEHTVSAVDVSKQIRIAIVGDSYSASTGATLAADGWGYLMGRVLAGVDADVRAIALGGTGYQNAGTTGLNTMGSATRIADLLAHDPDLVIFAGGVNDSVSGEQAAALAAFQAARTALPTVPIIALGSFLNVAATLSTLLSVEAAIKAAVLQAADSNLYFVPVLSDVDPWLFGSGKVGATNGTGNSDWAIGTDGVHPPNAGHKWIAHRAARAVRQLLPIFPRLA